MTNTRSKVIAATLAAATLAGPFAVTGSQAQAGSHHKFGVGLGIGIATGALLCAAATSYSAPVYVRRHCHYERYVNDWGRVRVVKVCDDY